MIRDFSEKLAALFPNEPQFEHWQNKSVTIEVSVATAYLKEIVEEYEKSGKTIDGEKPSDEAHFDLSDYYMQEAPVVHRNTDAMIGAKIESGALRKRVRGRPGVVREKVDGCGKQYWSGRAVRASCTCSLIMHA